jgi:hypothetical protein
MFLNSVNLHVAFIRYIGCLWTAEISIRDENCCFNVKKWPLTFVLQGYGNWRETLAFGRGEKGTGSICDCYPYPYPASFSFSSQISRRGTAADFWEHEHVTSFCVLAFMFFTLLAFLEAGEVL